MISGSQICAHTRNLSCRELNFRLNLINDRFEQFVDVMKRVHSLRVELEVHWGNLLLVRLLLIAHLHSCVVPISNILLLWVPDVDVLHNSHELMLQGLVHVLVDHVELRLLVELVLDGGLMDAGRVGWDHGSRTKFGDFYKVSG